MPKTIPKCTINVSFDGPADSVDAIDSFLIFFFPIQTAKQRIHRPKKGSEHEPQLIRFDLKDHHQYPILIRTMKKSKYPKNPSTSTDELPLGLDYFDPDKNSGFVPVTNAPFADRLRKTKKFSSNHVYPTQAEDTEPTTMQSIQNMVVRPKPDFISFGNADRVSSVNHVGSVSSVGIVDDVTTTLNPSQAENNKRQHLPPAMYKFTLKDAVIRPNRSKNSKKNSLNGPVTTSQSFDELPSNVNFRTYPATTYQTTQTERYVTESPKYYYRHTRNNERNSSRTIRKIERGRPNSSTEDLEHFASRQYRRVEAKPMAATTTELTLTESNGKDELQIRPTVEKWPIVSRNPGRSRHGSRKRKVAAPIAKIIPEQLTFASQQQQQQQSFHNLEVSPSYTKQRTQGIHIGEDFSTTPMTATEVTATPAAHHIWPSQFDPEPAAAQEQNEQIQIEPQNTQNKYFQ